MPLHFHEKLTVNKFWKLKNKIKIKGMCKENYYNLHKKKVHEH